MRQNLFLFLSLGFSILSAQNFTGKQKFSDPGTRNVFANMGYSTALTDSFAFIAAPQSAYDTANANPNGNAGIVLVYKRNSFGGWNFHQKIQSSNRNNLGQFGWSMVAQDSLLVVGARGEWVGFPNNGAAHIYQLQNDRWVHQQRLISNDTASNARMGCAVAIDGNTIVVGAERNPTDSVGLNPWGNSGAAYVFEYQNGIWSFKEKLSASVQASGYFGAEVAVQGNEIFVAAPEEWLSTTGVPLGYYGALYRFKRNAQGNWNQNLHYTDTLFQGGGTLAKSIAWQDSNLIISNLEFSFDTIISGGAVFHLNLNKLSTDPVLQIITAPFPLDNDQFGHDLVLEWPNLFIGVPNEDHDANQQNPMASAGAVYWYQYSTVADSFQFQQLILPQDRTVPISTFDSFGWSVAYSNGELLVGARNDDEDSLNLNYLAGAGSAYFLDSICFAISSLSRDTLCYGESLNFNGQILDSSGTYQAIFTAANGCDSTVTLDLHVNNVYQDSSSIAACLNYQLPNGQIIYQSGIYSDTLSSVSGCDSVVISYVQIDTVDTRIIPFMGMQALYAPAVNASFQWIDCDNNTPIAGATNDTLFPQTNGRFAVIVNQNGCSDTSDCIVVQFSSLKEFQYTGLEVYPNPTSGTIYFNRHLKAGQLFDSRGRKLMDIEGTKADISRLRPGVYWIEVQQEQIAILKR